MADVTTLAGSPRDLAGKGPARAARRAGAVPGVIYGNKLDPVTLTVQRKALEQLLQIPGFFTRLLDVQIGGEDHRVLPRDVQFHPVSDLPVQLGAHLVEWCDCCRAPVLQFDDMPTELCPDWRGGNLADLPAEGGIGELIEHGVSPEIAEIATLSL